jgi:Fic family protein
MARINEEALRRIRGEYLEMPGLRLTTAQAQRLWNLDRQTCEELLGSLVASRFLAKTRDGSFVRAA